jgi:hypothetical protein
VLLRTSVPPCFSVMPMPSVMPGFSHHGLNCGSYWRARILGSSLLASAGSTISAATAARVMVIGHRWPVSTCAAM